MPRGRKAHRWRWFLAATGVSSVGDGFAFIGFPLLGVTLTRQPLLIAGLAIASRLPWLLVGLQAGALADRWGRRRVLSVTEVARAAIFAVLALTIVTGRANIWGLYVAAFSAGCFETLFVAAIQTAIPEMVSADRLGHANGRVQALQAAGTYFVGPGVGALVFNLSPSAPFFIDAGSFAASALVLVRLFEPQRLSVVVKEPLRRAVKAGIQYLVSDPLLRNLSGTVGILAFCQGIAFSVQVLFAVQTLHLTTTGYGVVVVVIAVGDVVGSMAAGRIIGRASTGTIVIAAAVTAALGYAAVGVSPNAVFATLALTIEAAAVGVGIVAIATLRQKYTPPEMLGRVTNAIRALATSAFPLGVLVGGFIAGGLGLRAPYLVAGVVQLAFLTLVGRSVVGLTDPPT